MALVGSIIRGEVSMKIREQEKNKSRKFLSERIFIINYHSLMIQRIELHSIIGVNFRYFN